MICFAAVYITVWRIRKKRAGGIRMHDRLFIHLPHSCLHLVLCFLPVSAATYLIWSEANLPDINAKYV
ncbi:unknown [Prevotella sp. CAG:487]|nr:unknown [Prevotella sp. CAG:487]